MVKVKLILVNLPVVGYLEFLIIFGCQLSIIFKSYITSEGSVYVVNGKICKGFWSFLEKTDKL